MGSLVACLASLAGYCKVAAFAMSSLLLDTLVGCVQFVSCIDDLLHLIWCSSCTLIKSLVIYDSFEAVINDSREEAANLAI